MNHEGNTFARRIVLTTVVVAAVFAVCPSTAAAVHDRASQPGKHPIPYVSKLISHDGKTYSERIGVDAGDSVRYRVSASMPEDAGELETLAFELEDVPDADVRIDADSANAFIADASGATVMEIAPDVRRGEDGHVSIKLGNLRKACPSLEYGHVAVVEYAASISKDAARGEHPNSVKLSYDDGSGVKETVGAMAVANVSGAPEIGGKTGAATKRESEMRAGGLPTTGDGTLDLVAIAAMAMTLAAIGAVLAWVKAKAMKKGLDRKDRNEQLLQADD